MDPKRTGRPYRRASRSVVDSRGPGHSPENGRSCDGERFIEHLAYAYPAHVKGGRKTGARLSTGKKQEKKGRRTMDGTWTTARYYGSGR